MNEHLALVLVGLSGCLLGTLFFGGLWWTVRKGVVSKRPALWFLVSLLLRTGIVLAGFYLVSGGRWERLLACVIGFITARFIVTLRLRSGPARLAGPPAEHPIYPAREVHHAPESR